MKLKNIFFLLLCMTCSLGFVSCDDDDDNPNTHTNAAPLVVGTYTGDLVDEKGNQKATDVKITLSLVEAEGVQAVTLHCTSTTLQMDQEAVFNVAKAGENRYLLSTASTGAASKSQGVIENDQLTFYANMTTKYKFSLAVAAKQKKMTCSKISSTVE